MAKVRTKASFMTISHPDMPELKVTMRKLEAVEAMDLFSGLEQHRRVIAIADPRNKEELLKDNDGEIVTKSILSIPASAIIDLLGEVISTWEGLSDEDDKPIPYSKSSIKLLFQSELNIKKEDGAEQLFADYLQQEFNNEVLKNINEASKSDPKKKTSPKRA